MSDGLNRTQGEKERDDIFLKLLTGIFKSLEKVGNELEKINDQLSQKSNKK